VNSEYLPVPIPLRRGTRRGFLVEMAVTVAAAAAFAASSAANIPARRPFNPENYRDSGYEIFPGWRVALIPTNIPFLNRQNGHMAWNFHEVMAIDPLCETVTEKMAYQKASAQRHEEIPDGDDLQYTHDLLNKKFTSWIGRRPKLVSPDTDLEREKFGLILSAQAITHNDLLPPPYWNVLSDLFSNTKSVKDYYWNLLNGVIPHTHTPLFGVPLEEVSDKTISLAKYIYQYEGRERRGHEWNFAYGLEELNYLNKFHLLDYVELINGLRWAMTARQTSRGKSDAARIIIENTYEWKGALSDRRNLPLFGNQPLEGALEKMVWADYKANNFGQNVMEKGIELLGFGKTFSELFHLLNDPRYRHHSTPSTLNLPPLALSR
jgi:hypothetical protein